MTKQEILEKHENLDLMRLPEVIERGGYEYRLVERTPRKCLYIQLDSKTKKTYAYEVFKNKVVNNHLFAKHFCLKRGVAFVAEDHPFYKELFPGNEEFGKRAWSYMRLDLAKQKYDSLP